MSNIPPSYNYIQQESVQFNNPVSENALTVMGASINALLAGFLPPGSIIHSMLTEGQFQSYVNSTDWVLADGRNVAGSQYESITGNSTIPDMRGYFLRGKDYGTGRNPDGNLTVGTPQAQAYLSHAHGVTDPTHNHAYTIGAHGSDNQTHTPAYGSDGTVSGAFNTTQAATGISIQSSGGNETRPINVTVNIFIRIN